MGEPRGGGRDNICKLKPTTELRLSCRLIGSGWAYYDNLQRATKCGLTFHFANGWGQGSDHISLWIDFFIFKFAYVVRGLRKWFEKIAKRSRAIFSAYLFRRSLNRRKAVTFELVLLCVMRHIISKRQKRSVDGFESPKREKIRL